MFSVLWKMMTVIMPMAAPNCAVFPEKVQFSKRAKLLTPPFTLDGPAANSTVHVHYTFSNLATIISLGAYPIHSCEQRS